MLRTKLLRRTPGFLAMALAAGVACAGPFALTPSVSAKTHDVQMTAVETEVIIDGGGDQYKAWTFNGQVPGPVDSGDGRETQSNSL